MFAQRKYDIELRNELNDLKEKMAGLSIMNEFAKYAKLQRRYNQLENILKKNSKFIFFLIFIEIIEYIILTRSINFYELLE